MFSACAGSDGPGPDLSASSTSATDPLTSGASQSSTSIASTTTATTDTETGDATTGGPECEVDEDCASRLCIDGHCAFCPSLGDGSRDARSGCMGCGEALIQIPHSPRYVVLLVDTSRSMAIETWDHDDDPNTPEIPRWSSTTQAIQDFVSTYPFIFDFGLVLFPGADATDEYGAQACLTSPIPEVPIGPDNEGDLLAALPAADALVGATPTRAGFEVALAHLDRFVDPRAIVLVTDGAPNCKPGALDDVERLETLDEGLVVVVADTTAIGIPTFVVGVDVTDAVSPIEVDREPDGVDPFDVLDALAVAGGVPSDDPDADFYDGSSQIALQGAFDAIAAALFPCVLDLDGLPPPLYPEAVELRVGGVDYGIGDVRDCASDDGWRPLDPELKQIELCGQACVDARKVEFIELQYKCPGPGRG